jgi:tetratricopeptide (TPR) repeat protein
MLSLKGIMLRRFAFLLTIILGSGALAGAAAVDPKEVYDRSTNSLYNLDFNIAQSGYETLTREHPDNPEYWTALASSIWLRITFEQQKLNLESFSGSVTFGTRDSRDEVDPADEKRLRDTLNTAIAKADAILKKKPKDAHALYEKGLAYSTLASFEGTVKRSYISAAGDAKTAKKIHQDVLKLDPGFDDARISIGIYDYVVGVIPGWLKLVVGVFGISGAGKDAGIQNLELAAAKGKNASTDAKMILSVIYSREKRYNDALRMMSDLHSKYPRNFLFEMAEASTYGKLKRYGDADRTYHHVIMNIQTKKDGYERIRIEKVYYLLGNDDIHSEQFDKAIDDFSQVTSGKNATPDEKAGSHMWLGKIFDSKKDRPHAIAQYEAILTLNCSPDLKADAEKYRRRPWGE